jgi:hypothetical protein
MRPTPIALLERFGSHRFTLLLAIHFVNVSKDLATFLRVWILRAKIG